MTSFCTKKLSSFVSNNWNLTDLAVELMQHHGGRYVYRIDATQGAFVLKLADKAKSSDAMYRDLAIFDFAQDSGFNHLPRLIKTVDGQNYASLDSSAGFLTTFVGHKITPSVQHWEQLANVVADLHSLPGYPYRTNLNLIQEQGWAFQQTKSAAFYNAFICLFDSLPDFSDYPNTLIHTDIGFHNCAINTQDEILLTDWDDVGVGPRIFDIGFPLLSQFFQDDGEINFSIAEVFYGNYFEKTHIPVSHQELLSIFDASLLFSLLYLPYGNVNKNWGKINVAISLRQTFNAFLENLLHK